MVNIKFLVSSGVRFTKESEIIWSLPHCVYSSVLRMRQLITLTNNSADEAKKAKDYQNMVTVN